MADYRLEETENYLEWDNFAQKCKQYSIFSNSSYFLNVGKEVKLFFIRKGQAVKAGIFLTISKDSKICTLDDLIIYNGILFKNNTEQKSSKARGERFIIIEFIIRELHKIFKTVEMRLSPHFEDLRPFLWHNYHSVDSNNKYQIELRYTSYLDITEFFYKKNDVDTTIFNNLDYSRQSDLRKAENHERRVKESKDVILFMSLYQKMLQRQKIKIDQDKLKRMDYLIKALISDGIGTIFSTFTKEGDVAYSTVFTHHQNKGVYLFGAGNKNLMERYDGTFCIWNTMKKLSELGISEIDMEGINSPDRGYYKLGFGGSISPYYRIKFINN